MQVARIKLSGKDPKELDSIANEIRDIAKKFGADVDEIIQAIKSGATLPLGKPIPWRVRLRRGALNLKRRI